MPAILAPTHVFITGAQRSGTTLLDRLLGAFAGSTILSQPLPLLFVEAKRAFLQAQGRSARYPLGPLFPPESHALEDFTAFLDSFRPSRPWLQDVFAAMTNYSGQYTKFDPAPVLEAAVDHVFPDALARMIAHLAPDRIRGLKETTCEEFVPALLERGWRFLLVVRDPRDVLVSLNHGAGRAFAGRLKPTLFNVRQWRKSVAIGAAFQSRGCTLVRYEDLVARPRATLATLVGGLGLPVSEAQVDAAIEHVAATWSGNTSSGERRRISTGSVGVYETTLPPAVSRYVEAACLPELKLCGYTVQSTIDDALAVLDDFDDPYPLERPELADYARGACALECARLLGLVGGAEVPDSYYIHPAARARLAGALR